MNHRLITSTTDPHIIKAWTLARGGQPAKVATTNPSKNSGLLCIDFGVQDENLKAISWDEFFTYFDQHNLTCEYQEQDPEGNPDHSYKIISSS